MINEALLMSTHNICFHADIRKLFHDTPSNLELCFIQLLCKVNGML